MKNLTSVSESKKRIKKSDILKIKNNNEAKIEKHAEVSGITVIDGHNTFPISWLQKQGYCEYQIYLEHFRKIKARPTFQMIEGSKEHHRLEREFVEKAQPATFDEMLDFSTTMEVFSREFPVLSSEYGIHGLIDEIIMSPESFIIIDDKPGNKAYKANMLQVFGYCLAFKEMIGETNRKIYSALRERGTDNIYWMVEFDENCETEIINSIQKLHRLINNEDTFLATDNPNKCRSCRFKNFCDSAK